MPTLIDPHVRWMLKADMAEVQAIEGFSFDDPWTPEDILRCLRPRKCRGFVAEVAARVVGYMIYHANEDHIEALKLAVCPKWRGAGIGRALARKLTAKLSKARRTHILVRVDAGMADARAFLKAVGFTYEAVADDHDVLRYDLKTE